jgi:hypothetical protein
MDNVLASTTTDLRDAQNALRIMLLKQGTMTLKTRDELKILLSNVLKGELAYEEARRKAAGR